jgi:hypothetical protein
MIIFDLFDSFLHVRPRPGIISHFPCPLDDMAVSSSSMEIVSRILERLAWKNSWECLE